jgi:hypothetical protein
MNKVSPPPIPASPQIPMPSTYNQSSATPRDAEIPPKGPILSWASIIMACFGILPVLVFILACMSGFGIGVIIFFLLGIVAHGFGVFLGIFGYLYGKKNIAITGIIGNGIIVIVAILCFLVRLGTL